MKKGLVIGAGPAGLMAADAMASAGLDVTIAEAKPSPARKFLMAGKSGLNLTKDEPLEDLLRQYSEASGDLQPMLEAFDSNAVIAWAQSLRQEVFTGSTGRVFPKAMKASPLLRTWIRRLDSLSVTLRTGLRWSGWNGDAMRFASAEGPVELRSDVVVLALGGASWMRLGSDGQWMPTLVDRGVQVAAFAPANVGLRIRWSDHMSRHFGAALKGVALTAGRLQSRGEAIVSSHGLEGGGIYEVCRAVREQETLYIDLLPGLTAAQVTKRIERPRGKNSLSNHLRKSLKLDPIKVALAQEFSHPLPPDPQQLAAVLKALPVRGATLRPMDQAISTAGGVSFDALNSDLMLREVPGVFCAGEMLDWEAPTGGYLITASLATGRWAGQAAARYAETH